MSWSERLAAAGAILGALILYLGYARALRPRLRSALGLWRRFVTFLDTVAGRSAGMDAVSGTKLPEVPPLHERLLSIEETQRDTSAALKLLAEVQSDQASLNRIAADHEARLLSLEDVEAERALTREESREMWRAINNRDVIDVDSEEDQ